MSSIFSKIICGEIPAYKIAETQDFLAFLDIQPLHEGHTLVIPKKEIDYLFDVDDEIYQGLFDLSKKIATALKQVIPCKRIGMAVVGLEVPHAHIHLVPIDHVGDINFMKERPRFTPTEFEHTQHKIQQHFFKLYPQYQP